MKVAGRELEPSWLRMVVMQSASYGPGYAWKAPEWVILGSGCLFILVLGVSAYWEADIRWLHFLQSLIYLLTIVLALRGNRWGYFIGASVAGFWCYLNLFVTTFFVNGLQLVAH